MEKTVKVITWPQLQALARKHYNEGGDAIIECWTETDYNEYVQEYGPMTERQALDMFTDRDEIIRGMESDANSYREEATQDTDADTYTDEAPDAWVEYYEPDDEWRPGDAPWNAPGMSLADFI